jgi:hypothetical protein
MNILLLIKVMNVVMDYKGDDTMLTPQISDERLFLCSECE